MAAINFLRLTREVLNRYAAKEREYTIAAITITISRLGPSGSLKSANITLVNTRDVMIKIICEVFFDLKFIGI